MSYREAYTSFRILDPASRNDSVESRFNYSNWSGNRVTRIVSR